MKRLVLIALVACSPAVPRPPAGERVAEPAGKGVELGDLDRTANPCTDFYAFANGGWRATHPIPPAQSRWSQRLAARETNRRQVQVMLEEVSARADWPAGSTEQLIGDHYTACLDEAGIDAAGLTPLAPWLDEIDRARTPADLQRAIRRLHELAVPVPFGIVGTVAYHAPANFIANVVAGGLGLPDRDAYRNAETRAKYRAHVATTLQLAGAAEPDATHDAEAILAFETQLAMVSLAAAEAGDPAATDHEMTFDQLQHLAPHFAWDTYFDEAHLPRGLLNVAEPTYLQRVDQELSDTPVATWKAYLRFHLLDAMAPWLAKPFADEAATFTATEMKPRARRCVESTETLLGELVGKKYVEHYFPPRAKAKARELVRALLAALQDELTNVAWMQPATKAIALDKLAATDVELGYPDTWKDYSTLPIGRASFWTNVVAARRFNVDDDRRQIGKPTHREAWQLAPSSPDAYIDFQRNQLVLPAGFLQAPTFDLDATDAVNYGSLGVGLAHDLTHGIDLSGSEVDKMGRPVNWWTDPDRAAFAKLGQCVIDQFEGYTIEPGTHLQGKRVLSEAIGDLAGLRIAYAALVKSMATHPIPTIDGFTPLQQFFIAWGRVRGEAVTLEAQREMINSDIHPIPKFRVIGALANSPEFQQAFSCSAPATVRPRCSVW
ncbi:MAG: M13 family metallopeptidase [Kofleriaceae bacterium]